MKNKAILTPVIAHTKIKARERRVLRALMISSRALLF